MHKNLELGVLQIYDECIMNVKWMHNECIMKVKFIWIYIWMSNESQIIAETESEYVTKDKLNVMLRNVKLNDKLNVYPNV